ncbi:c-type cytochrome [Primorskyibacter sp. S187A]|uniref:c-type cytochrome n=1 Tax=Primorskyibacter sp. S187A TaxID=3415130 RepID=UPI003C7A0111
MLDTMTFTKVLGSVCGALLVLLLGKWVAEELYHVGGKGHGDHHDQAYVIDTGEDEVVEEVAELTLEEKFAAADAGKGERVWGKCRACHKLEQGANGTGPYLYGVVNRAKNSVDGFGYSGNLGEGDWTPENLYAFLESPRDYAPGTSMSFAGLKKWEDRVNLIAYLETIGE